MTDTEKFKIRVVELETTLKFLLAQLLTDGTF